MEKKLEKPPAVKPVKKRRIGLRMIYRVIVMNVINAALVVVTVVILGRLPGKASALKGLRHEKMLASEIIDVAVLKTEIAGNQGEIDKLQSLFVGEAEILEFYREMDQLKRDGVITDYRPMSDNVVSEKKNAGLPILIEMGGDVHQIDFGLKRVQSLPYLLRPVRFELERQEEGLFKVNYGGFLYVSKEISKN